jgi:hypothetical protein
MSTVLLCGCAAEQQASDSLARDLIDCVPKPTVADLWACASKKQDSATAPAPDSKETAKTAS